MSKTGYSSKQIRLHWIIALLVIVQFSLHDGILNLRLLIEESQTPSPLETAWGQSHVVLGLLIFVLAIVRLSVRLKQKAPAAPASEPMVLKLIAKLTHFMLYAILLVMPISGTVAWFGNVDAAAAGHGVGKILLLSFLLLHIVGAIYQHAILKTDVLKRIVKPEMKL